MKVKTRKIDYSVIHLCSVLIWLVVSKALDLIFRAKGATFIFEGLEGNVCGGRRQRGGV